MVKHNLEVNWEKGTIWFIRCPRLCKVSHQEIMFKTRKAQTTDTQDSEQQEIDKEPDPTNLKDLPEYIWSLTYLFNKKKFEKLLGQWEWDHEINLTEDVPKELNVKAYAITIKEEESLNQWLDE